MGLLALLKQSAHHTNELRLGLDGVTQTGPGIDALHAKLAAAKVEAKATGEELKQVALEADKVVEKMGDVQKARREAEKRTAENAPLKPGEWRSDVGMAGGTKLTPGFSATEGYQWPVWGELLTPEQKIAQGAGVTPNKDSAAAAAAFKSLADRIDKWQGDSNNYWSQLLNKEIPYLTKGATSSADAQAMISAILKNMLPGIMQELANPKTPIEMRKILEQLMQFAQSGNLQIDKLAKATDRIEQGLQAVGETVHAGIGGLPALNQQLERTIKSLGGV